MSSTSVFPSFNCNLFCVFQTLKSAARDSMLLIRERRYSRGAELFSWLPMANSPWETECLSVICESGCVCRRNSMGPGTEPWGGGGGCAGAR